MEYGDAVGAVVGASGTREISFSDLLQMTAVDMRRTYKLNNEPIVVAIPVREAHELCAEYGSLPAAERALAAQLGAPIQLDAPYFEWNHNVLRELTRRINHKLAMVWR